MNGFAAALRCELYAALRAPGPRLILLAPAALAVLRALAVKLGGIGAAAADGFDRAAAESAWGQHADGLGAGLTLLGLMLVAQAAYSFSHERDTGVIRHVLVRAASRPAAVLAKLLTLNLLALPAAALLAAASYGAAGALWEYGPVVEDGFELIGTAEIRRELALGLYMALLPLPAAIAFGMLVSVCAGSATSAVAAALGLTLAMDAFKSLLGGASRYLYAAYQPSLLDRSYLGEVSRIVRGYSDVLVDERALMLNELVPWPSALLLAAAALAAARRRAV